MNRFRPKTRHLRFTWIWAHRPSIKGSKLLFPVIKANKINICVLDTRLDVWYTHVYICSDRYTHTCIYVNVDVYIYACLEPRKLLALPTRPQPVHVVTLRTSRGHTRDRVESRGPDRGSMFRHGCLDDWCCFDYFVRNRVVVLLEVLCTSCPMDVTRFRGPQPMTDDKALSSEISS